MLAKERIVSPFERPVSQYMTRDVITLASDAPLGDAARTMNACKVSCIPIIDAKQTLVGIISRTDLVALGTLPRRPVGDVMTKRVYTLPVTGTIRQAAQLMASYAVHRVVIVDGDRVAGIAGALEIATAVRDARIGDALSTIMSSPAISVDVETPLSSAVDQLVRSKVSGLVVTASDRPVGTFTQTEALATRDLPRTTPIESVFEPAVLCLPAATRLEAAAEQLLRHDVRRIVACKNHDVVGVVTTLDFARYVAW